MYASRASSAGWGGPPAPAHIVSSMNTGPRGMNGASPFMRAQPERDIDSTPAARPTDNSSLRIAWAMEIAPDNDEAQKRLTVMAGTESGKPDRSAAQRAMSPIPSWAGFTHPATMSSMRSSGPPLARTPRPSSGRAGRRCGYATASRRSARPASARPQARKHRSSGRSSSICQVADRRLPARWSPALADHALQVEDAANLSGVATGGPGGRVDPLVTGSQLVGAQHAERRKPA